MLCDAFKLKSAQMKLSLGTYANTHTHSQQTELKISDEPKLEISPIALT